jgi:hypothetical protein
MDAVWKDARVARATGPRIRADRLAARLTVVAATASLGAAAIHAVVTPSHLEVSALLGALFLLAAVGQAVWPALALARPSGRVLALGAAGNGLVLAGWAASRTVGLPFGHDAWVAEPVEALDATAAALEATVVAACLLLARIGSRRAPERVRLFAAFSVAAVVGLVAAAVLAAPSGSGSHHAPAEPAHQHVHAH